MKIKEIWLNLMNTITMKVFATLILLDISLLIFIIKECIYFSNKSGGEVLAFFVMFSIPFFVLIKIFIPTVVYIFEKRLLKQGIRPKQNKFSLTLESISVIIQLLILTPLTLFTIILLYNNIFSFLKYGIMN